MSLLLGVWRRVDFRLYVLRLYVFRLYVFRLYVLGLYVLRLVIAIVYLFRLNFIKKNINMKLFI